MSSQVVLQMELIALFWEESHVQLSNLNECDFPCNVFQAGAMIHQSVGR
jgi:hypothetical protein